MEQIAGIVLGEVRIEAVNRRRSEV